jgi:hypothetical protein
LAGIVKTHRKSRFYREDVGDPIDLAGATALIIRRLLMPLAAAVVAFNASPGFSQGAFPAPLPSQAAPANDPAFPPVNGARAAPASDPAFPAVNGAAPAASFGAAPSSFPVGGAAPIANPGFQPAPAGPSQGGGADKCMKAFLPLRQDAEKRGKLIQIAGEKHAPPDQACKLIKSFGEAEIKMIKYVETHSAECGIPPSIAEQLKNGHKNTESMEQKVCAVAVQAAEQQKRSAGPSLSDVLGSAATVPDAASTSKKRGTTFDTLSGNALQR